MVVAGLYEYYQSRSVLGSLQYEVAILLLLLSNLIIKENFASFLSKKITTHTAPNLEYLTTQGGGVSNDCIAFHACRREARIKKHARRLAVGQ
jgi:hypothetical protein